MNEKDKTTGNKTPENSNTGDKGERIAKALARAGIASRREVERMIEAGRVSLDGQTLKTPAVVITSLEGVRVDGEAVERAEATKVWRMHKTKGTLTTTNDPDGRRTVFDRLPKHIGRVISVGRLDMNTEGLLLLTNDGAFARWMELPANALVRRYRVRVYGHVEEKALARLAGGITIEGIHYGEIDAKLERLSKKAQKEQEASSKSAANTWLTVSIREGKNREVRRVMEYLGLTVNRLIRTHYGPFSLGTLPSAVVAPVNDKQLRDSLPEYFADAPQSVAALKVQRDTSRWAKAKKPTGNKPGAARRRKPAGEQEESRRPSGRKSSARIAAERSEGKRGEAKRGAGRSETGRSTPSRGRPNPKAGQSTSGAARPGKPASGRSTLSKSTQLKTGSKTAGTRTRNK